MVQMILNLEELNEWIRVLPYAVMSEDDPNKLEFPVYMKPILLEMESSEGEQEDTILLVTLSQQDIDRAYAKRVQVIKRKNDEYNYAEADGTEGKEGADSQPNREVEEFVEPSSEDGIWTAHTGDGDSGDETGTSR